MLQPISLIANSGIQFHKFKLEIDSNADVIKTMGFHEYIDIEKNRISLSYAYYLPDDDIWVNKEILKSEEVNVLDEEDNLLLDEINSTTIKGYALEEDEEYYTVGDIDDALELFLSTDEQAVWLPIPYFQKNESDKLFFGPVAWARMMIRKPKDSKRVKGKCSYDVVISFDTTLNERTVPNDEGAYMLNRYHTNEPDNRFAFSWNEDHNLNFSKPEYGGSWVHEYIKNLVHADDEPEDFPYMKYMGYYLYLLKYLGVNQGFPEVEILSEEATSIDVDLVLDIGNSKTCGLLFESPFEKDKAFNFNSVEKLKLQDFSFPEHEYNDPFSMRLAFSAVKVGRNIEVIDMPSDERPFKWPSLLRLGKEASRLINQNNLQNDIATERNTHHSSPKRYLWDSRPVSTSWRFINNDDIFGEQNIYLEGVSDYFKQDGSYTSEATASVDARYSKKSLMTFVFMEVIAQAIRQVNSYEFRRNHPKPNKPRKLKRITITCPTSIIQHEQVVLRECALEAVKVFNKIYSPSILGKYDEENRSYNDFEIVPHPKELAKKMDRLDSKKDWNYDESTCCQLVFLYAEIAQRYNGKADLFFDLYGKKRSDSLNDGKQKSLTIGSIDIGGGTTDLMICAYDYEEGQTNPILHPQPLYWESYTLAGDDLVKNIVQQVILEDGTINDQTPENNGYLGIIVNHAKKSGVEDIAKKMLDFFGTDTARQSYSHRVFRKNFIVQIAKPIAEYCIAFTVNSKEETGTFTFADVFGDNQPNEELIEVFNEYFAPLKLEDVEWKVSKKVIYEILEKTFDGMFRQLSTIMSAYGCDFVLLAGRPTTIPKVRELFVKYYPVSPEKLITLNQYRVGRWYPFNDGLGQFEDPKTIVSVGAIIALMAGKLDKLGGKRNGQFSIRTDMLIKKMTSTADYIGTLDNIKHQITTHLLSPTLKKSDIEVYTLPMIFGYKQLPNEIYKGRPIYKLIFNDENIINKVLDKNSLIEEDSHELRTEVEYFKSKLRARMPFRITIRRNWSESKEHVIIEKVRDKDKNDLSPRFLSLFIMTLPDESGYWLDTGEFTLNIKA